MMFMLGFLNYVSSDVWFVDECGIVYSGFYQVVDGQGIEQVGFVFFDVFQFFDDGLQVGCIDYIVQWFVNLFEMKCQVLFQFVDCEWW